jgi:transcription initiation factor TFIIIB Brf1 subunit/transcription initiation factor TFIIB
VKTNAASGEYLKMLYALSSEDVEAPCECSKCGRVVTEDFIDSEMSQAFEHVCLDCAEEMRADL